MRDADAKADLAARVSRETLQRLEAYVDLLEKWQRKINLISPSTLPDIWSRHMLDSAQVMDHAPDTARTWLDLGSGGGFPGLVCAAIAADSRPDLRVSLVESDQRKCAFLREAARVMDIQVTVHSRRIEDLPDETFDVISARALAPLTTLCGYAVRHLSDTGICLFQKGARHADELATARRDWHMTCTTHASVTDAEAVLIRIEQLTHV
jgi:16S rRNA (guanine527-N7)-methyltransferase